MMSPKLLDAETLFDALITAAAPTGLAPIQALHADSFEEAPFVSWQTANNGQYDYGLWNVTLILNIVAEPQDIFGFCNKVYTAITNWNLPGEGVSPGVGGVINVGDSAVFDKVLQTMIHGKYLSQTTASFQISVESL